MDIEEKIAKRIVSFCYTGNDKNEVEIIEYGLQLMIESISKLLFLAVFALCIGEFKGYIEFLIIFGPIRANAGGIHCKTNVGCTIAMVSTFVAGVLLDKVRFNIWLCTMLFAVCVTVCMKWAPSSTEVNPITDAKLRKKKKIICVAILFFWYIESLYSFLNVHYGYIIVTYISIIITILLQERRRNR